MQFLRNIRRRDFIATSSGFALTPVLSATAAGTQGVSESEVLDMGYLVGSDRSDAPLSGRIVPAVSVDGDPTLASTGVDVEIRGFSAPAATLERRALRAFSIDVACPARGTNMCLWRFDDAGVVNVGSDAHLKTPVDAGLQVALELVEPSSRFGAVAGAALFGPTFEAPLRRTRLLARMTADESRTHAGLRRGVYIIAGRCRQTDDLPQWRAMRARVDPAGAVALVGPFEFPYIVLTVDRQAPADEQIGHAS